MEAVQPAFGQLLRERRKKQRMTLRQLEERSGISYSQLSKIERGESVPLRANVERLARALKERREEWLYSAGYLPDSEYKSASRGPLAPQMDSLQVQERSNRTYGKQESQELEIERFHIWLAEVLHEIGEEDQRRILEEVKEYVKFKKFQLKRDH